MNKKIKFLKFQLGTAIFVLVTVLVSGFFVFGPELSQVARALDPNNYNKQVNGVTQLVIGDWDRLDDDFVAKSGDTMTGALVVPSATVQNNLTVNGKITSAQTLGTDADNIVATKKYVDDNSGGGGSYVDKAGDTMTGVLNMSGNRVSGLGAPGADGDAVSRGVMNTAITGAIGALTSDIKNTSGADLRMVCGTEDISLSNTTIHNSTAIHIDNIDTSAGGFISPPIYMLSIYGLGSHYKTTGANGVYDSKNDSFDVYIRYWDGLLTDIAALPSVGTVWDNIIGAWGWGINWCAIGN